MRKIAIYARYSSDLQNARSCEDQGVLCHEFIAKRDELADFPIEPYFDANISGAFIAERFALQRLMEDVENNKIKIIITEGLDRLSRSQEDIARIYKLCRYHDVPIHTLHEGTISEIHVGLTGTMSAIQLEQIAQRTRRGQAGNIRQGKAAGGLPYGYKLRHLNDQGVPEPGLREIDPKQAKIVKRIFDEYCNGKTTGEIIHGLNRDNIPSPRGGRWVQTTINGHTGRGNGILQNAIYKGELLWNRNNFKRHPSTGIRHVRYNSADEVVRHESPELLIISKEQWELAQQIRKTRTLTPKNKRKAYEKLPFEIFHAQCRASMIRSDEKYLVCSLYKGKRMCKENRKIRIDAIMEAIYNAMIADIDSIWEEWKREVNVMNKKHRQLRRQAYAVGTLAQVSWSLPVLDGVGKKLLTAALKRAADDPNSFLNGLLKRVAVEYDDRKQIRVSKISLNWDAFTQLTHTELNSGAGSYPLHPKSIAS